jgi:2-(1,2-epoxy-1,2-dihydrophenyl)acetyl-CoA isomerase
MSSAAPTDPPVLVERDDVEAVATVRLNRPASRNALTRELKVALRDALGEVAKDSSVRAVVLAANGPAFCVGQDLREHAQDLREHGSEFALATVTEDYNPTVLSIAGMPKPVIASIAGTTVGAGLGIVLACDLRVATAGTKFGTAFSGIGFTGDSGLSASLAHSVGASRAVELLMLGDTFTAEQAHEWGMVRELAADAEATDAAAIALARRLAAGPTLAYAEIKRAVALGAVSPLPTVLEHEARAQVRLGATEDHRNAVEAFLAKEKPEFHGR